MAPPGELAPGPSCHQAGDQADDQAGAPLDVEDEMLALLFVTIWAVRSGRILPLGVRPDQLDADALIEFWADDQMTAEPPSGGPSLRRTVALHAEGRPR